MQVIQLERGFSHWREDLDQIQEHVTSHKLIVNDALKDMREKVHLFIQQFEDAKPILQMAKINEIEKVKKRKHEKQRQEVKERNKK